MQGWRDLQQGVPSRNHQDEGAARKRPEKNRSQHHNIGVGQGRLVSGHFLVVQKDNPRSYKEGNWRIEVECYWFEKKPKTSWMHLTVNNGFEYVKNYKSEVIHNIGRSVE